MDHSSVPVRVSPLKRTPQHPAGTAPAPVSGTLAARPRASAGTGFSAYLCIPGTAATALLLSTALGVLPAPAWAAESAAAQPASAAAAVPAATDIATVSGRITDAATGDALSNALVSVADTAVVAATDTEGNYVLQLPAGTYRFTVSYGGMDDLVRTVTVSQGEYVSRNFVLSSAVNMLEKVVVQALRAGQAAAIHEERQAPNVRTVAEIDAFGNPGAQAGELLQRLPGIAIDGSGGNVTNIFVRGMSQDFSSLLIDGNQIATSGGTTLTNGNVYFGQVATGNISSLEVIKAATPDMDGNAIAGYLNMRTKRSFERAPVRTVSLTAGTAWADTYQDPSVPMKDKPDLDLLSLQYSDVLSVFGGRNNLGISANVTRNIANSIFVEMGPRQAAAAQNAFFVAAPAAGAAPEPLMRAFGAGHWGAVGKQSPDLNLGLNVDYKLSENTVLYSKITYNRAKRRSGSHPGYFRWKLATPATAANFAPGGTYDLFEARNGTLDLESFLYVKENEGTALSGGVERKFLSGTAKLTAEGSYSKSNTVYPSLNQVYAQLTGVGWLVDRRERDPWMPLVLQTAGANWSDPASYRLRTDSQRIRYEAPAERWGGRADFQKDFFGAQPFTLKAGVKQGNFSQTVDRTLKYYTWAGPAATPAAGGIRPYVGYNMRMSNGRYGPFPFLQLSGTGLAGDVWESPANWTQSSSDVWNTTYQSLLNDVAFEETVDAGYVQASTKLGRLRILGGVRLERTSISSSSFTRVSNTTNNNHPALPPEQNAALARDNFREWVTRDNAYTNTFPGLHLAYSVAKNLQARASYNVTITRPSPANLLPNIVPNETAQTLSAGNPALRPYKSDNFEAGLARYFSGIGQLSAGVFLKEISDYFRQFQGTVPTGPDNGFNGEYAGWTLTQNRNIGSARIRGVELNYQQQYTFLPGAWRGLGSFANFTYLETWGDFGSATGSTNRLPNLTPRSWNGGLTFARGGLALRLLANYRSGFYRSSANGTFGSGAGVLPGTQVFEVFQHERLLLDFKLQYSFLGRYVLLFDVYNLTRDWGTNDYVHLLGHEVPSYASTAGTSFKVGLTTRF